MTERVILKYIEFTYKKIAVIVIIYINYIYGLDLDASDPRMISCYIY